MPIADDYVDVAERIRLFYEKYPDGSLQSFRDPYVAEVAGKHFVVYSAAAYRKPDDPCPAIGWAWEPIPGPTNFTRDSELMNAETSAWGRAIAAAGFAAKKIATAEEVRNRAVTNGAQGGNGNGQAASEPQKRKLGVLIRKLEAAGALTEAKVREACQHDYGHSLDELTKQQASQLIERLETYEKTATEVTPA